MPAGSFACSAPEMVAVYGARPPDTVDRQRLVDAGAERVHGDRRRLRPDGRRRDDGERAGAGVDGGRDHAGGDRERPELVDDPDRDRRGAGAVRGAVQRIGREPGRVAGATVDLHPGRDPEGVERERSHAALGGQAQRRVGLADEDGLGERGPRGEEGIGAGRRPGQVLVARGEAFGDRDVAMAPRERQPRGERAGRGGPVQQPAVQRRDPGGGRTARVVEVGDRLRPSLRRRHGDPVAELGRRGDDVGEHAGCRG